MPCPPDCSEEEKRRTIESVNPPPVTLQIPTTEDLKRKRQESHEYGLYAGTSWKIRGEKMMSNLKTPIGSTVFMKKLEKLPFKKELKTLKTKKNIKKDPHSSTIPYKQHNIMEVKKSWKEKFNQ